MQKSFFFCAWSPLFSCFLLHVPLYPFFLVSLCLLSPWLINSALLSYFADGDRLSHHCRFPCYGAPLVTNTDSSPSAGPKSQLEKTEIQPLKLPSEDYSKLPQLLPSPLSVSSTQCCYHNHHSQCDWIRISWLQQARQVCTPQMWQAVWSLLDTTRQGNHQQMLILAAFYFFTTLLNVFLYNTKISRNTVVLYAWSVEYLEKTGGEMY